MLAALLLGTKPALTQSGASTVIPDDCRFLTQGNLADLKKRMAKLEAEVTRQLALAVGRRSNAAKHDPQAMPASTDDLRRNQEELLQLVFQIDCIERGKKLPPIASRSRGAARESGGPTAGSSGESASRPTDIYEVPIYYATNRNRTGDEQPTKLYGSDFAQDFSHHYGRVVVTIPRTHVAGNIELPSLWKLETNVDPSKHFVLKSVAPLETSAARAEMSAKLANLPKKALLVFVHGYNTSFADSALRTAQMAHDIDFTGLPFFYSWPSAGKAFSYWQDEEAALSSEEAFERLVFELSELPASDIYIVAHSMGNRIASRALSRIAERSAALPRVRELLLAAPDINAELFRNQIAPKLVSMQGLRTTVYASSTDLALVASKFVHGFHRVGETSGGVKPYSGLDMIDASAASLLTRSYGHSYVVDSPQVIKDIRSIVLDNLPTISRHLQPAGAAPNNYWRLP
jgi:esterase/lipase superfamily enzyme